MLAAWPPWGRGSGWYQQVATLVDTLRRHGTVDLCLVAEAEPAEVDLIHDDFGEVVWVQVVRDPLWAPKMALGIGSPVRHNRIHPASVGVARKCFEQDYDLTWCVEQRTFDPVADLVRGPVVLDLYDVMSSNVAYKRRIVGRHPLWAARLRKVIRQPEWAPGAERQWRRWEAAAVRACDRVMVRSELDRARLGGTPVVVPNNYPVQADPAGRRGRRVSGLDICMVGLFDYQPNLDGARWFISEVLPIVRRLESGARFHLIGRARQAAARALAGRPGVVVHGYVEDLEQELAEMSVAVAPVRFGGGTRVKILEAWAHELPIVATTIGAEGLHARDGDHLLVRDDPVGFAHAVVELHRDRELRERLISAGRELHAARYTPEHSAAVIERELAALLGLDVSQRT